MRIPLSNFFDAPTRKKMQRATRVLEPKIEPGQPFHIVSAHPTTAHGAFTHSNARHNGLTLLAAHHRDDGWTTVLYEHAPLTESVKVARGTIARETKLPVVWSDG